MPRRPAIITQADVSRTIRAAKQSGAFGVEVRPDGTIFIHLSPNSAEIGEKLLESGPEVVL